MSGPGANGAGATGGAVEHHRVAIVGSGFAGLGMAIRCKQEGIEDFVILERGDDVGGTWRVNTYPGCQCDVPSHLYSFSFMPNPDWSRTYSNQPEIWDYLRRCAVDGNILGHLRLNCELRGAAWVEERRHWRLQTSQGELTADVLVAGSGPLTEPSVPAIAGLESFQGAVFHSADWDHDQELAGKRVAVVGTGASSIQFVPEIQPQVESMTLFQRTPPWVLPHRDRPISRLERLLYRVFPPAQKLARGFVYMSREPLVLGLVHRPGLLGGLERLARKHLADQVADPELRRRLRPNYRIGCKRILQSNDWYPALTKPNVEVVTAGISEVRENGVVDADGRLHEVDAIILGTGFNVFDPPIAHRIRGRDEVLSEAWERGMRGLLRGCRRRLSELLLDRRAEHGPRPQLDGLHDRVAAQLRARLPADDGGPRRRQRRGAARGAVGLQRGAAPAARGHGVERGRLCKLVHRRPGAKPQHLAAADLDLPAPDPPLRRRELPARGGRERVQWQRLDQPCSARR